MMNWIGILQQPNPVFEKLSGTTERDDVLDKKWLKYKILICTLILYCGLCGCTAGSGNVKVYDGDMAGVDVSHEEVSMVAVVSKVDIDGKKISFIDCVSGNKKDLIYNGGVSIKNAYGNDIDIADLSCGEIMDVTYYEDTGKLVDMTVDSKAVKRTGVTKLVIDADKKSASYKGIECNVAQFVTAYDDGLQVDVMEISTEDQVTLNFYGDKLMSIVVELGHGYVRLTNQNSYIGGMVEIGYDVIVPVTADMLLEVREGSYTLRISKNGYSQSMEDVVVVKGEKTDVDLLEIAIPRGTAVFNIEPEEAILYVGGKVQATHSYSDIYGDYTIKIEADGYNTFNGKFTINDSVKNFDISLTKQDETDDESDSSESDDASESTEAADNTTEQTATASENVMTNSTVTINSPTDVGVYVDGEYVGMSPVTFAKTVGTHTVTLYKSGYLIKSYTIQSLDDGNDDTYTLADLVPISSDAEEVESQQSTTEAVKENTTEESQ
jgi:hypothetical protein